MKKKLAIIGGSYLQLPIVKKAKTMGIETYCFSWHSIVKLYIYGCKCAQQDVWYNNSNK